MHLFNTLLLYLQITIHVIILFLTLTISMPLFIQLFLKTIKNATTLQYLSNLKPSNSCGHDNISSAILKFITNEISDCITLIMNQSISSGPFPENLKLAKGVPIFKKDDTSQNKNYRPISVLPVISKIFENVMHTHTNRVFTDNNLLSC